MEMETYLKEVTIKNINFKTRLLMIATRREAENYYPASRIYYFVNNAKVNAIFFYLWPKC
jgi:hypothetical protein